MAIEINANGEAVTAQGPTLILREALPEAPAVADLTYTIGAAGDYTTWSAAAVDWNAGTLSGSGAGDNITFQEIDGAAYNEVVSFTDPATAYASITLTASEAARHDGTPGSGARIVANTNPAAGKGVVNIETTSAGISAVVEWLEVDAASTNGLPVRVYNSVDGATERRVSNCIVHGGVQTGSLNTGIYLYRGNLVCTNNIVFGIAVDRSNTIGARGITVARFGGSDTALIANNTIYDIHLYGGGSGNLDGLTGSNASLATIKNNVVVGCVNDNSGTNKCFFAYTSAVTSNNASEDATAPGSDSLTGLASSVWNDAASDDFQPASGSTLFEAGADLGTTSGVNVDITGRDRDAQNDTWSIGAWQVAVGEGGATIKYGVDTGVDGYVGQQVGSQVGA